MSQTTNEKLSVRVDVVIQNSPIRSYFSCEKKFSKRRQEEWLQKKRFFYKERYGKEGDGQDLIAHICADVTIAIACNEHHEDIEFILGDMATDCRMAGVLRKHNLIITCHKHPDTNEVRIEFRYLGLLEYLRDIENIIETEKERKAEAA